MAELVDLPTLPTGRQARTRSMYFLYVLQSEVRNYVYVGITNDVQRRYGQHQAGKEKTTKHYRPFKLVFTESYPSRPEARAREKYLKSGSGKEWLKNCILKLGN